MNGARSTFLARLVDPALADIGGELWRERPDLQKAYPERETDAWCRWLLVNGPLEYPARCGARFPPLPDETLRAASSGGPGAHVHLWTGLEDCETVVAIHDLFADAPLADGSRILDFGCGAGRLLRWLAAALPAAELHGCDIQTGPLAWCREHLRANLHAIRRTPPVALPLPDRGIDFAIALSVFSHLEAEASGGWMRELARVCRPGAPLLVSTLGTFALYVTARGPEQQQLLRVDAAAARGALRELERRGYFYFPRPPGSEPDAAKQPVYDQVFVGRGFVHQHWEPHVEVLAHLPAAQGLFQDWWVLRRR